MTNITGGNIEHPPGESEPYFPHAVVAESNLKLCFEKFPEEIKSFRGYDYYYKQMKETNYLILPFNSKYVLQRIDFK
ncbi:hypothetical protein [uncultured Chryseobacterium sp.]|uniref:hypothetical protein n=1 Tax=uncultured Chryseobacterium sp. TaxID=259322 RepID=UPI0025D5415A|nr:hypothetical protein [uncultured Chryseobacterium sp.]